MGEYRLPEEIARRFHDAYERLAPDFGYKTRDASAVPWEQVPENNRALMIATVTAALDLSEDPVERVERALYEFEGDNLRPIHPSRALTPGAQSVAAERLEAWHHRRAEAAFTALNLLEPEGEERT